MVFVWISRVGVWWIVGGNFDFAAPWVSIVRSSLDTGRGLDITRGRLPGFVGYRLSCGGAGMLDVDDFASLHHYRALKCCVLDRGPLDWWA